MHIQVINFRLKDLSVEDFYRLCDDVAPTFAAIPGLISKVWLANPATGVFGGVYTWRDRAAMEAYAQGELCACVMANPHFDGITAQDFSLMEGPTRVTHGLPLAIV